MSKIDDAVFVSLGARAEDGDDAGYLRWHGLDHRPELHRIPNLRGALRVVSTPACRAARRASAEPYDAVDHVVAYVFDGPDLSDFAELGRLLGAAGKMTRSIPPVAAGAWTIAGMAAASHVVSGARTLPWRPALGAYLLVGSGPADDADLLVPGVAGVWSLQGDGRRLTWCFLDDDPVAVAGRLGPAVDARGTDVLLAAPFHTVEPFAWDRWLP